VILLEIIPVLDILNGIAVHAMHGEREKYRPLKSVLCASANPIDIALAFKSFGFNKLYIADLDAILGKHGNFTLYRKIKAETNLNLMIDAGINNIKKAEKVLEAEASNIIIGTETLNNISFIKQAIKSFGKDRVIVSIDLKEGKVMSKSKTIKSKDALSLAKLLEEIGVTKIIILDLARVGSMRGVDFTIIQEILKKTSLEVLTGGGIRNINDLKELKDMGVSGALIATVLHTGILTLNELKSAGFI
jgi:phosphoribosylformimino-5-aminoimidazole carboxamide ribotide isomerase